VRASRTNRALGRASHARERRSRASGCVYTMGRCVSPPPVRTGPISGVGSPAASCHCCRAFSCQAPARNYELGSSVWRAPGLISPQAMFFRAHGPRPAATRVVVTAGRGPLRSGIIASGLQAAIHAAMQVAPTTLSGPLQHRSPLRSWSSLWCCRSRASSTNDGAISFELLRPAIKAT